MWSPKLRARRIILILLLGFILRFFFFLFNQNYNYTFNYEEKFPEEAEYFKKLIPPFDSQEFLTLAENLSTRHKFTWAELPNTFRTPIYPVFIALFGRFAFHPLLANLLPTRFRRIIPPLHPEEKNKFPLFLFCQIFIATTTVLLTFFVGRRLFNEKVAEMAAFLLAIDIPNILFSSLIMSETLLLLFLILGTFLLFQRKFFFSGITFALAALTKPIALYLFIPISLFLLLLKEKIKSTLFFLFAFFLLISIWMVRNYGYYRVFAFTSIDGYNLLYHNLSALEMKLRHLPFCEAKEEVWRVAREQMNTDNPLYLSQIAQNYTKRQILAHPGLYTAIHLKGMFLPLFGIKSDDLVLRLVRYRERDGKVRQSLSDTDLPLWLRILIFFLGGWEIISVLSSLLLFLLSFRSSSAMAFKIFLFLMMIYFLFIASPLPDGRFRIPSLPFLYLGAASFFKDNFRSFIKVRG